MTLAVTSNQRMLQINTMIVFKWGKELNMCDNIKKSLLLTKFGTEDGYQGTNMFNLLLPYTALHCFFLLLFR
jgi:hypothetical protein